VAGVAGGLSPAAFYTGPPATPAPIGSRSMGAPRLPPRSPSPPAPSGLTEVLSKMTESLTTIQSQLASQATSHTQMASQVAAQAAANKSLEDKVSKL
jgi:hypothetical protein